MTTELDYLELLIAHQPSKPQNREELDKMIALLETLAENEIRQSPAVERFIETLMALVMQYENELEPDPESSPSGVLKFLMDDRGLKQSDLVPVLGVSKSYVSQILSGHRPISKPAAAKLAKYFHVTLRTFL